MNIYNISVDQMDDMATDYLNGMYESQYSDEEINDDQADGNQHTKVLTQEEIKLINDDIPF